MGGGGEDFGAQQAAAEAKKQQARDALNLQFGVAPSTTTPIDRNLFTTPSQHLLQPGDTYIDTPATFDQGGYDAAVAAQSNLGADAAKTAAARESLYSTVRNDAFDAGKRKLDESKDSAARDLRFTLFGQGLNGGSADIDQNAQLGRTYDQGVLDLGGKADAAAAGLRSNDEQTRLGLLQAIDSGLDQGSAISSSLNQLKVNSDQATAAGQGTDVGDLFANAGLLYTKSQAARGATAAQQWWNYPQSGPARNTGNTSGIISGAP